VATFRYDATGGLPHLCAGLWCCFTGIGGSIDKLTTARESHAGTDLAQARTGKKLRPTGAMERELTGREGAASGSVCAEWFNANVTGNHCLAPARTIGLPRVARGRAPRC